MNDETFTAPEIAGGYVLLSRLIQECSLWQLSPDHLRLAIYLLITARHKSKTISLPSGDKIKRGELVTSLSNVADDCSYYNNRTVRIWSRRKVSEMLNDLKKVGFLDHNSNRKGTHISICNYDAYQDPSKYKSNSPVTPKEHQNNTEGTQGEQTLHTNNKVNNAKKEKKEKKKADIPSECILPDGFSDSKRESLITWIKYRKQKRSALQPMTIDNLVKKWMKYSDSVISKAIDDSIENGWTGCFPEKLEGEKISQQAINQTIDMDLV